MKIAFRWSLCLDNYCWWVAQSYDFAASVQVYPYFTRLEDALTAAAEMNKLVPTQLEKSCCRWVTESRPKCTHKSCSTVAGNQLMCNACGHTWCPVDL